MSHQDIEVRITRDGKIIVRLDGQSEEQIRNFRVFLEEMIGPVQQEVEVAGDDDGEVVFSRYREGSKDTGTQQEQTIG